MQKFILIGHPLSGYQAIEELLCQHGMAQALPTQRDQFTPAAISALLCKAHEQVPLSMHDPLGGSHLPVQLPQVNVAPVWNGLVMDLLLSNMDQTSFWGWSDPQAIHLLDYWKQQDHTLQFIFIYNSPETAFAPAAGAGDYAVHPPDCTAAIDEQARQWYAYNAAMLHFYNRNKDRCVLLHAGQASVAQSLHDVDQLGLLLKAPLLALNATAHSATDPSEQQAEASPQLQIDEAATLELAPLPPQRQLQDYLASQLAAQYPFLQQLYEEMQALANWPLGQTGIEEDAFDAKAAWLANLDSQQQLVQERKQTLEERVQSQEDRAQLLAQIQLLQQDLDKQVLPLKNNNTALLESQTSQNERALQDENHLLLTQLHTVQEELEQYYFQLKAAKALASSTVIASNSPVDTAVITTAKISTKSVKRSSRQQRIIAKAITQLKARVQARTIAQSGEFDANWYLAQYPDVARLPIFAKNPALHYLMHGVEEKRSPSVHFSGTEYLRKYPDVRRSGLNPFLHYVCHGKSEGRS